MEQVRFADPSTPYRRRVRMRRVDDHVSVCDLEDDFHRFRVTITHDRERVLRAEGESLRFPWSTCPDAAGPLHALEGMPLSIRITAASQHTDPRANCTHMFDAAALAIAHAARGRDEQRQYDVEVTPDATPPNPKLWRDGELLIDLQLEGQQITAPSELAGAPWRGGFMAWADANLEPDAAEAAMVLRRATEIGLGRGMDLDGLPTAEPLLELMEGVCFTMTRGVVEHAQRNYLSIRDYAADPDGLLAND